MLSPRGNNHQISRLDILVLPIDGGLASATRERQGLVDSVYFIADVPSNGDSHEHELRVEACPEDSAERG